MMEMSALTHRACVCVHAGIDNTVFVVLQFLQPIVMIFIVNLSLDSIVADGGRSTIHPFSRHYHCDVGDLPGIDVANTLMQ